MRGEWSFAAKIDPNPLVSGSEDGATVTFTATFNVNSGTATELSAAFTGASNPSIDTTLVDKDGGKVIIANRLGEPDVGIFGTGLTFLDGEVSGCISDASGGTITCRYTTLGPYKLLAETNATPGSYAVTIVVAPDDALFTATATTDAYPGGFNAEAATKADVGEVGQFNLTLNVVSGLPAAPTVFTAAVGNSLATLAWTDPGNAGITGYAYRQTTDAKATLTWDADADATGWEYRQSQDGGTNWVPDWTPIDRSDASTTSHTVTEVDPDVHSVHSVHSVEVRPLKADPNQPAVDIDVVYAAGVFTGA